MAKVQLNWQGGKVLIRTRTAAKAGALAAADLYLAEIRRLILNTPKTGRMYGDHQASAPGEAPANWTGHLLNSFKVTQHTTGSVVSVRVTNTAEYAPHLEFGTIKMAPRPFLRPALANKRAAMYETVAQSFREGLK